MSKDKANSSFPLGGREPEVTNEIKVGRLMLKITNLIGTHTGGKDDVLSATEKVQILRDLITLLMIEPGITALGVKNIYEIFLDCVPVRETLAIEYPHNMDEQDLKRSIQLTDDSEDAAREGISCPMLRDCSDRNGQEVSQITQVSRDLLVLNVIGWIFCLHFISDVDGEDIKPPREVRIECVDDQALARFIEEFPGVFDCIFRGLSKRVTSAKKRLYERVGKLEMAETVMRIIGDDLRTHQPQA